MSRYQQILADMNGDTIPVTYKGVAYELPNIGTLDRALLFDYHTGNSMWGYFEWQGKLIKLLPATLRKALRKSSYRDTVGLLRLWFKTYGINLYACLMVGEAIERAHNGLEIDLRRIGINGVRELIWSDRFTVQEIIDIVLIFQKGLPFLTLQTYNKWENLGWDWTANTIADTYDQKEAEFQANSIEKANTPPKYKAQFHPRFHNREPVVPVTKESLYTDPKLIKAREVLAILRNPALLPNSQYTFSNTSEDILKPEVAPEEDQQG